MSQVPIIWTGNSTSLKQAQTPFGFYDGDA